MNQSACTCNLFEEDPMCPIHHPEIHELPFQKEYFHEVSQERIEELLNTNTTTWYDIMENYLQPDWCHYPEALRGQLGCWSLTDLAKDGSRTKISHEFCKNCDCYQKTEKNNSGMNIPSFTEK